MGCLRRDLLGAIDKVSVGKIETLICVTANEIGLAETVINTMFEKTCFSKIIIFAWQNGSDVTQNLTFTTVF